MKKIISIISVLVAAASLSACSKINSPEKNISDNSNSSQSAMSSKETVSSPGTTSSKETVSSQSAASPEESSLSSEQILWLSTQSYVDLKGDELIAKFEWPYDGPIELTGMTAETVSVEGDRESIPLSELSNYFRWHVECDYGYLAMTPEKDGEYEYKKYKAGDKIGDFTVKEISTSFDNVNRIINYFCGVEADFEGETTLTGEISIIPEDYPMTGVPYWGINFYPDAESRKKLPIVNFMPMLNIPASEDYYSYDNLMITLGDLTDYPEIDFGDLPTDGTHAKVKIKIKDYGYRAISGLPFIGGAAIADGNIEIL